MKYLITFLLINNFLSPIYGNEFPDRIRQDLISRQNQNVTTNNYRNEEELIQFIQSTIETHLIPGLSISIVKDDNIVWEKYPNAYLILIGLVSEFTIQDLKELVPKSQQNQIVYTGFINYKDIPSFYKAADLYVSASQYETFGYTLLEAIASAKPIVCTDRGAMPELVVDGFNGLIVPFGEPKILGESIIELLSNDELLKIFSKNSGEVVQKYDLSNYGDMLMQSYTEIINLPIN